MRAFVIDEITPEDMEKLENRLKEQELLSIEHLYHFNLPPALLSPMQQEHAPECGPFYMAVETGRDWVRLELLVRAKRILRCACIAYATPAQQEHMISYLENLLSDLGIPL
ncbi:hypothetical protein NLA06_08780 [Desulfomicrobium sp. ZS1]|jgi:hypothetical protein|uniref:hypothetical protein n=1 Tax=Desulfomicrobium sp. ZS1 TaxID=2952228 RepID=UPI0020B32A46|nr:hypothetical protein [Desulfomicrobium sp. ZS1]UTF48687.1 hypothetical protein NLA06_08780 [Desulfomicrobium sp. ZS1]